MTRIFYSVSLLLLISIETSGQCVNPPRVTLNSTIGNICGISPVTVSGTFDGSATLVTISEDGKGSVSPFIATASPFTFTYIPKNGDLGQKIQITVSTNNPRGPCVAARLTYTLTVNDIPSAPEIASVKQPNCSTPTGSVVLKNLPNSGSWTLIRNPGGTEYAGTGNTITVPDLPAGKYNFWVTSSGRCVSGLSEEVNIEPGPSNPAFMITDPAPVCYPSTVDLTAASITAGSSSGLTYTYWRNAAATQSYNSPSTAAEGTYYIKGTASTGCSDVKPVRVTREQMPSANAGPDKVLNFQFGTQLEALNPGVNETGTWSVIAGSGLFSDQADARTTVIDLALGDNIFLWRLTNGICQPSYDSVTITVKDLLIPTLITPNMDGRNDYFVIGSNESMGKMELVIFDRRGVQVYKNSNYDNRWDGIDSDGNPLPDNTYFFLLKAVNGKSVSGYIVIRR